MTVVCNFPEDMSVLQKKLSDVLAEIIINKYTSVEVDAIIEYLENDNCKYFN